MGKPTTIAVIEWVDQHYLTGPVEVEDLLFEVKGCTVGWLIAEDDKQVALAAEHFSHADNVRHVIHIPKVCIISRFEFDAERIGQVLAGPTFAYIEREDG